ncbi:MAG TPA: family 43 glycosylhydrolase [Lachnospiraceae bacterium]|nr:family 43 glycosylhydrolase [Lachnospiraceae bacterium]
MDAGLKKDGNYILCYTRKPQEEMIYSPKLAYSMHLAFSTAGKSFTDLNHNSGVLFAKSTDNVDGTLCAKSIKNPYIFHMKDGTFGVVAIRTEAEGENDEQSKGCILLFTSKDLLQYREVGLIHLKENAYINDVTCEYDNRENSYVIHWSDESGNYFKSFMEDIRNLTNVSEPKKAEAFALQPVETDIEGIVPRNVIQVSEEVGNRLRCKLTTPYNTEIQVQSSVIASTEEEIKAVKATAIYSDGTKAMKRVDWNMSAIDWNKEGTYHIEGKVHQDHYEFPITLNRADPCIGKWNGKYYFIATNDADQNHTLYIREADSIPGLVEAKEVLILDSCTYEGIGGLLWAPEFHIIKGDLYIFHAATPGEFFYEESHVMKLRKGGNPMCAADWSRPHLVVRKDGSALCEAGNTISLDMTTFEQNGEQYAIWSQRQFLPVDLGAWLYIAKIDPEEPWRLITDPIVLSRPEYGWANNHTFVDEGPYALKSDSKLFITFSSALVDATYVVGILSADLDADLLNPDSWTKGNYPLLTSRSVPGEYGTGHNSYVTDEDGNVWNAYHGRPGIEAPRSSGIRRVHFDIDGYPVLDMTEEKDVDQGLAKVSIDVIVKR